MIVIMVNIADVKAKLSEYIEAVSQGEQVIICRHNRPVAELRPIEPARIGPRDLTPMFPGETFMTDGFFDPMSAEELQAWEGSEVFPARVAEHPPAYAPSPARRAKGKRRP